MQRPVTFDEETVTLASGRTQVLHRGGQGTPLLWLHSLFGFDPGEELVRALAREHSVIAPVAPGFRDPGELADIDDVHDLALHYDDLLEALGLDEVAVVGHSFGAMIAAELAAHVPRRVSRLVLMSPLGLWRDEQPVEDLFAVPYTDIAPVLYARPERSNLAPTTTESGERDVERLVALASAMTTVAKFLWPIPDRALRRRLYRITAPTLVVFGERDALVPPAYADDFVAGIPDARSASFADAGHMVHLERWDAVRDSVEQFLGAAHEAMA